MPSKRQWEQFLSSGKIPKEYEETAIVTLTFFVLCALLYILLKTRTPHTNQQRRIQALVPEERIVEDTVPLLPTQMQGNSPAIGELDRDWNVGFFAVQDDRKIEICVGADQDSAFNIVQQLQSIGDFSCWNITLIIRVQSDAFVEYAFIKF
jgi:hypothetical protein